MTRIARFAPQFSRLKRVVWCLAALVLMAPLVAMQFTSEVQWDAADFALLGGMFAGAGLVHEVAERLTADRRARIVIAGGLVLLVLLAWAEGAVGLFD
jgi:hypothetical protein